MTSGRTFVIGPFFKNKTIKRPDEEVLFFKSIIKTTVCIYMQPIESGIYRYQVRWEKNAIEKREIPKKRTHSRTNSTEYVFEYAPHTHTHAKENQNTFMVNICIRQIKKPKNKSRTSEPLIDDHFIFVSHNGCENMLRMVESNQHKKYLYLNTITPKQRAHTQCTFVSFFSRIAAIRTDKFDVFRP